MIFVLKGVSEDDAEKLNSTVRDLAELKYVKWAQAIVALADTED